MNNIELLLSTYNAGKIEYNKIIKSLHGKSVSSNQFTENIWYNGDNLDLMKLLLTGDDNFPNLRGKINLIYIDPPYNTNKNFYGKDDGEKVLAYTDKYGGIEGYLKMIIPRLFLMKDLLADDGSILVHCDWRVSSYMRLILDEIFGKENFRNEIIWGYGGGGAPKNFYPKKHDNIFWYSKSNSWKFIKQYRPYSEKTLQRGLTKVKGDKYKLNDEGAGLMDYWTDDKVQKILSPTAYENLKYPTQKPESLLKRIIKGHTDEGDIVADFFCGSGTTIAVAEKLGRKWVGSDNSELSNKIVNKRMKKVQMEQI